MGSEYLRLPINQEEMKTAMHHFENHFSPGIWLFVWNAYTIKKKHRKQQRLFLL